MSSLSDYQNLAEFNQFLDILDDSHFLDVNAQWTVIVSDVIGSTQAVQQGRFKQVNIIGAASITCIMNTLKTHDFPFVFGGDGSTVLLPTAIVPEVIEPLRNLKNVAFNQFDLDLRIGYVSMQVLLEMGATLKVGRYALSKGNNLAQFKGNALTKAEELIKNNHPSSVQLQFNDGQEKPNLDGLSCRLQPMPAKNGIMLSLLCHPTGSDPEESQKIMNDVLQFLHQLTNDNFSSFNPVKRESSKWRWIPDTFWLEVHLMKNHSSKFVNFFRKLFEVLLANTLLKLNLSAGGFEAEKYKKELVQNSDFKKFDETLRMVIDCTESQKNKIEEFLHELYQQNKIFYGTHVSRNAIVTCVVYSASNNGHLHFVDGGDGGYTLAATGMKEQMRKSKN
ncbi:MAG: DUF3095 family protein [Bdellovibrionales bacterium]